VAVPRIWARVRRYLATRPVKFHVGVLIVAAMVLAAIFADWLPIHGPLQSFRGFELKGPSWSFPLGTDEIGRDLLSRIIYGGRSSFAAAFIGVSLAALLGAPLGLLAGLQGGVVDTVVSRVADAIFAMPAILIGIGLAAALGGGPVAVTLAIIIGSWPSFVRVARSGALQERVLPYVEALRSIGASRSRLIFRHVLPNTLEPLVVQFAVALAVAVLIESGLSFLGMGAAPPAPSWGGLLADSRRFLLTATYYAVFPGIAVSLAVIGINFIADGLRQDAKSSSRLRIAPRRPDLPAGESGSVLRIDDLQAAFGSDDAPVRVLNGVTLEVPVGQTLGVVGESGSGKRA